MKNLKIKINVFLIICCFIFTCNIQIFSQYQYIFQNPELSSDERITNLLSLMTLDEKVNCLGTRPNVLRLGVKGTGHVEGLHGLAKGGPSNWGQYNPSPTTIFPQAIGLAESWDTSVIRKVAEIEAYETRFLFQSKNPKGGLVVRAPNADLGRDIRWGRTEECYGEDAWFNAQMVEQFVKGLQGNHPKYWMTASLIKHFLANSNENGRDSSSSDFNERLFYEYYAYPFYKGITDGGSRAYMASYNAYNGIPMTVNPVLKNITFEKWGQDGIICTDGGAFQLLVNAHHYYPDLFMAAAGCIKAGINQFLDDYKLGVYGALANGYISEKEIDNVLYGVFRVMIKLGQLDPDEMVPYKKIGVNDTIKPWSKSENKKVALDVTKKTIVLLKNDNNFLPLNKDNIKSIAVIGRLADTVMLDWYSGTPAYRITPLQGIKNLTNPGTVIKYASKLHQAIDAAKSCEKVIVFAGNDPTCSAGWAQCPVPSDGKEAVDRKSIILEQEDIIKKIYAVNKNIVLVLISSFPYAINWSNENIPAILHMTHCSQETGNAIASVLFGEYNPAGRLVQTWPKSENHLPGIMNYDITNSRTYMYYEEEPLFPFGYGLSYSSFEYSDLKLSAGEIKTTGELIINVNVKNISEVDGEEVVQLYVSHLNSLISRPDIELKGFCRKFIKAGETQKVQIKIQAPDIAYWNIQKQIFEVEKDKIKLLVGSSSADLRLYKEIKVVN